MLEYILVENKMAGNAHRCVALISGSKVKNIDDVIDSMVAEGTGLTRPQALAYFEKLTQTIESFVKEGHTVITPLVRVQPSITGIFTDTDDSFDSSRHHIHIRSNSGLRLRALETDIKLKKIVTTREMPILRTFKDIVSGEKNLIITGKGVGVITGKALKFDLSDEKQGIFFTTSGHPRQSIRAQVYSLIKNTEVHFIIPELQQGDYSIIIKKLSRYKTRLLEGMLPYTLRM